jgi:hypothetical protein
MSRNKIKREHCEVEFWEKSLRVKAFGEHMPDLLWKGHDDEKIFEMFSVFTKRIFEAGRASAQRDMRIALGLWEGEQ